MPIINLTDVTVRLADENDEVYRTFEPDDHTMTIKTNGTQEKVDGVPVEVTYVTAIDGLPAPEDGTYYIVPQPVAKVLNRPDLVTPDTGPSALRNDDGSVYAVRRLFSVSQRA